MFRLPSNACRLNQCKNAEEARVVDGEPRPFIVPPAEQDPYPLNGTPVTMPPDLNRVLLRRVIDGMIAGDNPNTKIHSMMACILQCIASTNQARVET